MKLACLFVTEKLLADNVADKEKIEDAALNDVMKHGSREVRIRLTYF
jgi:hypothetical protein